MKISKSLLKMVAATATIAAITTSCKIVCMEPATDNDRIEKPENTERPDVDCPACGMG